MTSYQAFDDNELFDEGGEEEEEDVEVMTSLTSSQINELIAKHASQAVEDFNIPVTELGQRLDVRFDQLQDRLLKFVEDVSSNLKSTDKRLSKELQEVTSKAVESAKELAEAAISKQIAGFALVHLKDH